MGVIGLSGFRIVPSAAQVRISRVALCAPSPSDGPTGPVLIVARIAFSSPLVPGLLWVKPGCRFCPSPDQKLSLLGCIPTAQKSSDEPPTSQLPPPA